MKKILTILFLIFIIVSGAYADRSVEGYESFNEYRQIGDYRLWTFISKDTVLGTYISTVKEQITINGQSGYAIEQQMKLDYNKISTNLKFDILNRHFVAESGMYLGDKMKLTINDQTEEINVERNDKNLQGYTTRSGSEIDQDIELRNIKFAVEDNYIDQLESYLASLDITVGTEINDTIFMSQSLVESFIYGFVEDYKNVQLYNEVFDSSFVIELMYPTQMTAYFTPDKRLVKLVVPSRNLKIYQDVVSNPLKSKIVAKNTIDQLQKNSTQISGKKSISKLSIIFILYVLIGSLITFFFIKNLYKKSISYAAFSAGALSFILIPFTQIPLQEFLFTEYFVPHVLKAGESVLLWAVLPALAAGVVQGLLLLTVLILLFKFLSVKKGYYLSLGAAVGFGFGLAEAFFLAYGTPSSLLFGGNLVERIFLIMFHISAAVFVSYALKDRYVKAVSFVLITILLNSSMRYLPSFVQNKTLTPELLGIVLAFISISFLTYNVFLFKKEN